MAGNVTTQTNTYVYRGNPSASGFTLACFRDEPRFEHELVTDGTVVEALDGCTVSAERELDVDGVPFTIEVSYRRVRMPSGFEGTVCWRDWDPEFGGFEPV